MRVLFFARHFMYFRNFESAIELLARNGASVHLVADREEGHGGLELVRRLSDSYEAISFGYAPDCEKDTWTVLARKLRLGIDAFRFCGSIYDSMPVLRERAYERAPLLALWLMTLPARRMSAWILRVLEAAIPRFATLDRFIAEHRADVVLVTPLIDIGSEQLDHLRSAKRLGVPTALCVWSWDHLSSKALLREFPDRLFVWNDTQREEAVSMHLVPEGRVIVTGAQCFDKWFDRKPSVSREEFSRLVGLPTSVPYLLYVCSALFKGSPSEADFVKRWVSLVRGSGDGKVAGVPILIRPHPQRLYEWSHNDLDGFRDVVLAGNNPLTTETRNSYFDALHYCIGVVGLNTSALVEASIADHPVHTILLPEFRGNQKGTLHFQYLMTVGGGMLHVAQDVESHLHQLSDTIHSRTNNKNRGFVDAFIRPFGRDKQSTPIFVAAVERLASEGERPKEKASRWASLLRPVVSGLRTLTETTWGKPLVMNPYMARKHRARVARKRDKEKARRVKRRARVQRVIKEASRRFVGRMRDSLFLALKGLMRAVRKIFLTRNGSNNSSR